MNISHTVAKLKQVRNLPLLGFRLIGAVLPGGFLSSTAHLRKQRLIRETQERFGLQTFVETGTNEGDMIFAVRDNFKKIYSIELDRQLFQRASARLEEWKHIKILLGDSATVLPQILTELSEPCLFWLDAHYSGGVTARGSTDTPIHQEIDEILRHPNKQHMILIDDAWCFGTMKDYPSVKELKEFVKARSARARVEVSRGVIWVSEREDLW
jgi:hypothetical protein